MSDLELGHIDLDISTTICPHQTAAVGFELMTLGLRAMAPYALHHRCGHCTQEVCSTAKIYFHFHVAIFI